MSPKIEYLLIDVFDFTDIILTLICFIVAFFNASVGSTGGVTFAAMATFLPAPVVIPIHGLVEGLSSAIRWAMLYRSVNYQFLRAFLFGGLIGFVIGWPLIGKFSDEHINILLGSFMLLTIWVPLKILKLPSAMGGTLTSSLTLLVGATGPLVTAILMRHESSHRAVIATQGACTTFQHWGKVLLFGLAGFSFTQYIELIILLSVAITAGTALGKNVLIRVPTQVLHLILKVIVSILGGRLILRGLGIPFQEIQIGTFTGAAIIVANLVLGTYVGYQLRSFKSKVRHFRESKPSRKSIQKTK